MPRTTAELDQFVWDKVNSNVEGTPAADHIPKESVTENVPPGLNIAPTTTGALEHFTNISFELPDAADHGHPPGWLLGPI